jgi:hypothetical protein
MEAARGIANVRLLPEDPVRAKFRPGAESLAATVARGSFDGAIITCWICRKPNMHRLGV